ncbi:MAG TPA: PA14 domain-containing protein [Vicinamibacteria bacterium]|nr:PA14 domain-containing protein [Vicinamibacteria bacterium]
MRSLSLAGRLGFAVSIALLALAVSRWAPIEAQSPLDVRALALAGPALGFAILAALTGRDRRPGPWRRVALALVVAVAALGLAVALRGPAGLPAEVEGPAGPVGRTTPGAIDVIGRDLRSLPIGRRVSLRWAGELRVPASGRYELWVEGRGRAAVSLDGHAVLEAEGDPLQASTAIGLAEGPAALLVRLDHAGPGPRLRLGWTRPDGRRETIPPRALGPPRPAWVWALTDALALVVAGLAGVLAWMAPWEAPRRPPSPRPVTAVEIAVSVFGYVLLLAIMSWPLVHDLAHTGPMDRPDGRLNAWILAWAGETLWTDPARVFQAPAFHPLPDALAFSENLLLPAALLAPLQKLGGPVLAYNVALLGSLLLSGLAAQLLVRRVSGDRLAAFVAGAYFAAGPHRWVRLSHLHAQVTVFLPLSLLALDRFWERRSLRRALAVGLLLALQGLSSIYLGAITAAALAVAIAIAICGGLKPRELGRLAAGFLLAAAILWPVMHPYLRMRAFQGQEFTLETVSIYAASLPSYAAAGNRAWGWLTQRLLDPSTVRDTLFPGTVALALGVAGLAAAPRRYRAVAVVASAVAVVFSLGPDTALYRFLHEHVVLVRGVRALSRFALVPTLALSVLAGLALAGRRRAVVLGALGLMMVESANLPLRLERYSGPSPASRWLAGKEGAVLVLPLAGNDTLAMLDGLAHGLPLVNGDSGFIPRPFDRAMELFERGVDADGARFLRAVGVRHVVVPAAGTLALEGLAPAAEAGSGRVLEVTAGEIASVVGGGDPVATRFTPAGILVVLKEARTIGRVAFELSDAPWIARPAVEVSSDGVAWAPVEARASLADATLSLYRDPLRGRGEVRFPRQSMRLLRLDPRLPARPGVFDVAP